MLTITRVASGRRIVDTVSHCGWSGWVNLALVIKNTSDILNSIYIQPKQSAGTRTDDD